MRPFADVLSEVNKGTVRVLIEIAPVKGNDTIVQVSGSVDARPPRPASPTSFFYPDEDGNLSRNDPNTLPLFRDHDIPGVTR